MGMHEVVLDKQYLIFGTRWNYHIRIQNRGLFVKLIYYLIIYSSILAKYFSFQPRTNAMLKLFL